MVKEDGTREVTLEHFKQRIWQSIDLTPAQKWEPTEQDYRECCGVWVGPVGQITKVSPMNSDTLIGIVVYLEVFTSRAQFEENYSQFTRLEQIPEQCIL